jgi:ligand-binding sensor domain-containing protein
LATAAMEINPNAMLVTKDHVFAGTLGEGLYAYNREKRRWTALRDGLPSTNVTALAEGDGYIYVGTDNGLVRIEERKLEP